MEKGIDNMTREKALAASRILLSLDGFIDLAEEIREAVGRAEDSCEISTDFKILLETLLNQECRRLEKELEKL